jgi:hypothetical protein
MFFRSFGNLTKIVYTDYFSFELEVGAWSIHPPMDFKCLIIQIFETTF